MCGILASLSPAWREDAAAAVTAMRSRGPDASGIEAQGTATFAHTRLSILGLGPEGAQPAMSVDGSRVLVYNGEIYNFRELARCHGLADARCDTQVLFALLAQLDAAQVVAQLRGMYAFAYWDAGTSTLTAIRDPMGIKPLYVHTDGAGLPTLASSLAALLGGAERLSIDRVGLLEYVAFGHTGPVRTVYADVRKLMPGRLYEWQQSLDGSVAERSRTVAFGESPRLSVEQALVDSVRAHLVSDVEVGAFLSGGVDSTLLAALAARESGPIQTFTVGFPESPDSDESPLAEWNARLMGSKHETVSATASSMVAAAPTFLRQHGEPFGDAACLPLTLLAARAGQNLKVVLCGEGADELFGGYSRYRVSQHLARQEGPLRGIAGWWGRQRGGQPWARTLEAALWGGGYRGHAALLDSDLALLTRIAPDVSRSYLAEARNDWRQIAGETSCLTAARRYDRERWLPNVFLEKTDRATMACSLEGRLPYLDRVVAAAAPPRPEGTLKLPLRDLLHEVLPDVLLPDRKKGLAVNIAALRLAGLDGACRSAVDSDDAVLRRAFGTKAALALGKRADRSPNLFFRLAMLGLWEQELGAGGFAIES